MSTAQPPSDGDRPTEGPEAAPETAATEAEIASPPRHTTGRTTRTPAAKTPESAETPAKRPPAPRKRSTAKSPVRSTAKPPAISPAGEAPEILDAMLGKAVPAKPAPDTSTSPAEPLAETAQTAQMAETAELAANAAEAPESTTDAAETAVLPTADEFYAAAPTPATPAAAEPVPAAAPAAEPVPIEAEAEEPAAPTTTTTTATTTVGPEAAAAAAAAAADAEAQRNQYRSVNDIADRLDDSRFFSSLFDFTFTSYVTRKLAGPVYVVGLVLIGLGIVVGFANSLGIAIATNSPAGAFVFLLGVLVTLVAAILGVLLLRVTIEVFCAIIEIAQNTRRRPPRR